MADDASSLPLVPLPPISPAESNEAEEDEITTTTVAVETRKEEERGSAKKKKKQSAAREGGRDEEEDEEDDDGREGGDAVITPFAVIRSIIINELDRHAKERKRSARHRITRNAMQLLQRGVEAHAVDLFRMAGKVRRLQKQSTLRVQAFDFARKVVERKNIVV